MKRLLLLLPPLLTILAFAAAPALAAKAHQHGIARLDVAVEPGRIVFSLDTPLDNLVGFERAPRTDAERERVKAAVAKLKDAAALFRIDAGAGCTADKVELTSAALELGSAPAAPAKDGHAELEGHYEFRCQAGAKAGFVEVGLFAAFPALKRIELQVVTPRGQMKATLAKPASRVALVR